MLNHELHYVPSSRVLSQEVHGELVLLDLDGEQYFGLNEVGRVIWDELTSGQRLGAILDALVKRFDVHPDRAEQDLEDLLGQLLAHDLIRQPIEHE